MNTYFHITLHTNVFRYAVYILRYNTLNLILGCIMLHALLHYYVLLHKHILLLYVT